MNCAYGKKGKKTCYTLESLKKIAYAYNDKVMSDSKYGKNNVSIINVVDDVNVLHSRIKERLKEFCDDNEKCWKDLDFVKSLEDLEIEKFTFLPDAPQGKYAWLSTINIDDALNQLSQVYSNFLFLGAVPMDFDDLPVLGIKDLNFHQLHVKENINQIGIVFNTDEHYKPGQHWVSSFIDLKKKQIYFFDSVGDRPDDRVIKLFARVAKFLMSFNNCPFEKLDIRYNNIQHQYADSECGVYSINFIRRMVQGETFEQVINERLDDETMNKCRQIYFSND